MPHGNVMESMTIEGMPGAEELPSPQPTPAKPPQGEGPLPTPISTPGQPDLTQVPQVKASTTGRSAIGTGVMAAAAEEYFAEEDAQQPAVIAKPIPKPPASPLRAGPPTSTAANPLRGR
jgi:hypothetical protein